jgi:hypothetical protein
MARRTIAALVAAAALAAGCGGDDREAERQEIEANVHAYFRAFAGGDTARVCSLMTTAARNRFLEAAGAQSCPSALGDTMDDPQIRRFSDRLEHARVVDVTLGEGDSATVEVAALGITREIPLRKEDDEWKIEGTPDETQPDETQSDG